MWFEYAAAEWALDDDVRDLAAVHGALEHAIALKPDHVRANVLLGELLTYELDKKGDYEDASWRKARAPIELANRTDPDDPLPLYVYFESFLKQGKRPPAITIQGLEQAFRLAPENIEIRIAYAFALANQGQFASALKLAQSVAFDPHMGAQGQSLLDQLQRMREQREGAGKADATE